MANLFIFNQVIYRRSCGPPQAAPPCPIHLGFPAVFSSGLRSPVSSPRTSYAFKSLQRPEFKVLLETVPACDRIHFKSLNPKSIRRCRVADGRRELEAGCRAIRAPDWARIERHGSVTQSLGVSCRDSDSLALAVSGSLSGLASPSSSSRVTNRHQSGSRQGS